MKRTVRIMATFAGLAVFGIALHFVGQATTEEVPQSQLVSPNQAKAEKKKEVANKKPTRKQAKLEDPFPDIQLPVYPSALKVNNFIPGDMNNTKVLTYELKIPYPGIREQVPAKEVIKFYDEELVRDGWVHTEESPHPKARWDKYRLRAGRKDGATEERRFGKAWVSKDGNRLFLLFLRYTWGYSAGWSDLQIYSHITLNIDSSAMIEFMDEMQKEQKWHIFYPLLEKYMNDDSEIDFERALKENPDNKDLLEYQKIHNEMISQIVEKGGRL